MTIAKEISKALTVYKQLTLGAPRSGAGGHALRRESSSGKLAIAGYENNEITSHQQSTGKTHGGRSATFSLSGLLSPKTYSDILASILRGIFSAVTPVTAASITIAVPVAGTYTLTDAANTFLTKGIKIGDVIRITAGTYANAVNRDNNIIVSNVTETVITGVTMNGTVLIAEGPIASSTITVIGKKCIAPITGQTNDYWTVEEFHSDITKSELFTDTVFGSADISIPASGNTTIALNALALNRTSSGAQVLTSPIAETTTGVVQGINGSIFVAGVEVANITGATIKIDGSATPMGAVLGSNVSSDISRGILKVSGQLTAFYQDAIMSNYFEAATPITVVLVDSVDGTNNSDFVSFVMSKVKLDGDDKDTGASGIVRTYPFTAEINAAGGAALSSDKTIISIQDSQA